MPTGACRTATPIFGQFLAQFYQITLTKPSFGVLVATNLLNTCILICQFEIIAKLISFKTIKLSRVLLYFSLNFQNRRSIEFRLSVLEWNFEFGGQFLKFAGHFSEFGCQFFLRALLNIPLQNLRSKFNSTLILKIS